MRRDDDDGNDDDWQNFKPSHGLIPNSEFYNTTYV